MWPVARPVAMMLLVSILCTTASARPDIGAALDEGVRLHFEGMAHRLLDSINKTHTALKAYHEAACQEQQSIMLNQDGALRPGDSLLLQQDGRFWSRRRRRNPAPAPPPPAPSGGLFGKVGNALNSVKEKAADVKENVQDSVAERRGKNDKGDWYRKEDGVGGWGGICTCPNGETYEVGDNGDSCNSLACEGGTSGECGDGNIAQDSQGMKVTCGEAESSGGLLNRMGNAVNNAKDKAAEVTDNVQERAAEVTENVQERAAEVADNVQERAAQIQNKAAEMKDNLKETLGLDVGETIDTRDYPRLALECRYDGSSGLPGIAATLNLEFSPVVVVQVALNVEFGLGNGGTQLIAKLSTGVKSVSIPKSCDDMPNNLKKIACRLAEAASNAFADLFDLGGIIHPMLSDSIALFPFQVRFPGPFKSGLITDAYHLIDVPLFDFTREGMCLTTVHENPTLPPMQKYTMKALAVLMNVLGGDICFDTKANQTELETTGDLQLGLSVKADLFDQSKVDFMSIVEFLPDYMHVVVERVRPALTTLLGTTESIVIENFPPTISYEVDILQTLLEKLGRYSGEDVSDLVEMMETYTPPTPAPIFITVGSSDVDHKVVRAPVTGLVCPTKVSKANWQGTMQFPNTYDVEVVGTRVTVKRTDSDIPNTGWGMNLIIPCFQGPTENNYRAVEGLGPWGGSCTCPDGQVYNVGDNGNSCESLACEGGIEGNCGEGLVTLEEAGMKVTCATPTGDWYRKVAGVGGWGGICTCPNGETYEVGDNGDNCNSLACAGGSSGECGEGNIGEESAGYKVTCGSEGRRKKKKRKLEEMNSIDDMIHYNEDGEATVIIPEVVDPVCAATAEATRRRRKLRGEKAETEESKVRIDFPHGWVPENLHPMANSDAVRRKLLNQGLVTFAEGTGCSISVESFPVSLDCTLVISFLGKFTLTPSAGLIVDYGADGETLEIGVGLGFETSPLPGEGKPIPEVLVSLGNTLRTNKIDPGAMINEVFKEAIQFPTETAGMKIKFPAGDDKYMKLFAKPIGKLSSLEGINICLSSLLEQLSTMGAPDEFAQIASFLFQFQGYVGGDVCFNTPPDIDDGGALSMKFMLVLELFKIEAFDIWPLVKLFSTVNPALTSVWSVVERFVNEEKKDEINQLLAQGLPGAQALEYNVGAEIIRFIRNRAGQGGRFLSTPNRALSDLESLVCGDNGDFQFGSVPASCRPGSTASGTETAGSCGGSGSAGTDAGGIGGTDGRTGGIGVPATGTAAGLNAVEQGAYSTLAAVALGKEAGGITTPGQAFCAQNSGKPCVFPFTFNTIEFSGCTDIQTLCATDVDAAGVFLDGGKCGPCAASPPVPVPIPAPVADETLAIDSTVETLKQAGSHQSNAHSKVAGKTIGIAAAGVAMVLLALLAIKLRTGASATQGKAEVDRPAEGALGLRPGLSSL